MNPFRNRPFLLFFLILYTLLVTTALLYFRFPADKFELFCQTQLEQLLPGTTCSIAGFSYKFPLSVEVKKIKIKSRQGKGETLWLIDQMTISPSPTAPRSHFEVSIKSGSGKQVFSLLLQQNKKMFTMENIWISSLDLAKIPFFRKTFGREITGSLSGHGTYHGMWGNGQYTDKGQGKMTITKGSFGLIFPILSLKKIDLRKFTSELVLQENSLQLNKASFQGKELKGVFSGDLILQSSLKRSELSLKGALEPLPPLLKKSKYAQNMVLQLKKRQNRSTLPFLIQGTVEKPKFKFDS